MKAAWYAVSFLAVVNLLALALCAAWLWRTDRLDASRVHQVRELFARTIAEEQADAQAALDAAGAMKHWRPIVWAAAPNNWAFLRRFSSRNVSPPVACSTRPTCSRVSSRP